MGGLAEVADLAVLLVEYDGDTLLAIEMVAQTLPAEVDSLGLDLEAQGVDQVVGPHGDDPMGVDALVLVVIDGSQTGSDFRERNTASISVSRG